MSVHWPDLKEEIVQKFSGHPSQAELVWRGEGYVGIQVVCRTVEDIRALVNELFADFLL